MTEILELVIQEYQHPDWVFVSRTTNENQKYLKDLKLHKEAYPTRKYRVFNERARRVVAQ